MLFIAREILIFIFTNGKSYGQIKFKNEENSILIFNVYIAIVLIDQNYQTDIDE